MDDSRKGAGSRMKIGVIGLGKLGEALATRWQSAGVSVTGLTRRSESALRAKVLKDSDVLVLAVKPHQIGTVLDELKGKLKPSQTVISVCASVTLADLKSELKDFRSLIRAMPNTPALIGEGMTVLCADDQCGADRMKMAEELFKKVGKTALLEESLFDGVTGLSGCGPAYGYLVIEALSEAGVKVGIPRKTASLLAAQTLLGAAKMVLERENIHPAALKDEVTTPAGCTIDGLMALEEGKLRVTLIKAVLAAARRSAMLRSK